MVQALAFAELFAGGILFLCGWKGYTPAAVVKGEAGSARPLGKGAKAAASAPSSGAGWEANANREGFVSPFAGAKGVTVGRTDQGVDISAPAGTPVGAIAAGEIDAIVPNWFQAQPLVEEKLTAGPHAGGFVYYAEQLTPGVRVGQRVRAGQPIGRVAAHGTGLELGFGAGGGRTLAQATTGYTEGQTTKAGEAFRRLLASLGL